MSPDWFRSLHRFRYIPWMVKVYSLISIDISPLNVSTRNSHSTHVTIGLNWTGMLTALVCFRPSFCQIWASWPTQCKTKQRSWCVLKYICFSIKLKYHEISFVPINSVVQLFGKVAQSTSKKYHCRVLSKLSKGMDNRETLWAKEISRDLSIRWVIEGHSISLLLFV